MYSIVKHTLMNRLAVPTLGTKNLSVTDLTKIMLFFITMRNVGIHPSHESHNGAKVLSRMLSNIVASDGGNRLIMPREK